MRVFVAGATGALGSNLVPLLVAAGHEVVGTSRSAAGLPALSAAGATGVIMDGLDADSVLRAVTDTQPDVIVHQLTALATMSGNPKYFDRDFAVTNRLRTEGTGNLLAAARAAGVTRFLAQGYIGWPNERSGGWVKTEDDPLTVDPGREARQSLQALRYLERAVTEAPGIDGLVLRYGSFYGPGQAASRTGTMGEMIRRRRFPLVGGGTGVWSFIHIADAAAATAAAVERGAPGVYNIVDDEPARVSQWLPYLAEQLGAKPPMRLPAWLARPMMGELGVAMMTSVRGSSNAKATRELGWTPRYATWREGFRTGIG
ncbi:NAD-dependent epimerase/dehydratase [Beutenbergia cavernae DSM 12333]|uniref:NAD-dependent epimerase/dehydratase n=1 Tax=Beutenbergia cavernae (strain ATCC BAA-8 / DSM 12333 / CCUG 43141 / JCM 11478 / NBRC 16432 / NCIMB 13614 / HKI 0122) TaxID=471853 RepID=C5BVT9_BEUC1|nr:NAD(P)-dependent oxidoreductase [Beutenbergia cavernae]ACQ78529.1 NAD-dependent epimerase/dehydratase [Beutenbergia cavernae DSM 12333]